MILRISKQKLWGVGLGIIPIIVLLVLGIVTGHTILTNTKVSASTAGWDAGNILTDSVMTASSTMSASQIQAFLVGKVPVCDTSGLLPASEWGRPDLSHKDFAALKGWAAPPYTCLRDYSENGLSAAQIIYSVAQQYQINPEVLIVLLQKEQGLVTDTWPLPSEYRSATGYGCPDNAVCDTQYYGFTNQVTWAAKMYHAIETSSTTWYSPYVLGNNTIYYNPGPFNSTTQTYYGRFGSSRDIQYCGATTINIQNKATQALYDYTPYQPNSAAFNGGDMCSSYGNLNFYSYFTDWFGSTQIAGACSGTESPNSFVRSFYNTRTFEHFYSAYDCDINFLKNIGYVNEGAVFNTTPSTAPWAVPIYRYYNPSTGLHVWSPTLSTPAQLLTSGSGYQQEAGIVFYVAQSTMPGVNSIISYYNPKTYQHVLGPVLTPQAATSLQSSAGYSLEGPAFSTQ
ncbi:MAG: exported protein of unknown function [Candidatus Saccharibacteria bacterium]|nr:exported protein of unknown function [Candidatus Saccharibacteria bacterium]